jgi:DNA invertase Pin-like site-specific DNA recombinase
LRRHYRIISPTCTSLRSAAALPGWSTPVGFCRGTESSNPLPSSGESANHRSLREGRTDLPLRRLIQTVETLLVKGIGFRSLTEALDTTTAQGRLVFHMFGALAEFERSLIRERTQAGLAAARRAGRTGGRPPKLTDDDIEAAKAMLANPDIGVTQIAHRLGVSPATLYRYIPAARTANAPDV